MAQQRMRAWRVATHGAPEKVMVLEDDVLLAVDAKPALSQPHAYQVIGESVGRIVLFLYRAADGGGSKPEGKLLQARTQHSPPCRLVAPSATPQWARA